MHRINLNTVYDLTHIDWSTNIGKGNSNGMLPKATVKYRGATYFLKLGSYSMTQGFYGNEPIIELLNSRIGQLLGIDVLEFSLIRAKVRIDGVVYTTLVSCSKSYIRPDCSCISIEKAYKMWACEQEPSMLFAKRFLPHKALYRMLVYDYIICNLDRHGKNIEVYYKDGSRKIVPLFDNSLTILMTRTEKDMRNCVFFDDDTRVNNFLGVMNLASNLRYIDRTIELYDIDDTDREMLFQGLGKVTEKWYRDYVWKLLKRRVQDVKNCKIPFIKWR